MRFVIFGAGAVGGVIGARLAEHGQTVVLIARGAHYEALRQTGLRIESPSGNTTLRIPVVDHPSHVEWTSDDVALLTTKTQDTVAALGALRSAAPNVPVVCVQNGVENERIALRLFSRVYGVCVMCPTVHLSPGVVEAKSTRTTGILDIGRYPDGCDELAETVAATFRTSTFESIARPDIMRWKYNKLLMNIGNAVEAITGTRSGDVVARARSEGVECLKAAGIDFVSDAEERERRADFLQVGVEGRKRPGGSTWQSLERRTHSVETDYFNGEIVLLGRIHGIPTPVNALLQHIANEMARAGSAPGAITTEQLRDLLPF